MPQSYALIFPGQGSQYVGMGAALAKVYPEAAEIFHRSDEVMGFSVSDLCFCGPEEELTDTANLQPALFTTSIAAYQVLAGKLGSFAPPAAVAGHSLGEFSALVAAGAITFEDGLRLMRARGLAMKKAGDLAAGGMVALLGVKSIEIAHNLCAEVEQQTGLVAQVANENCPGQVVVSGHTEALELLVNLCEQREIAPIIRPLKVSIAGHSSLLDPALPDLLETLESIDIRNPAIPVISNVAAEPLLTDADIRNEIPKQLTTGVKWMDITRRIASDGIGAVVEVGPGTVLTKLVQRTERSLRRYNFGDEPETLEAIVAGLSNN
jgi:[acyl-carrier-protein] S-malonyltransferase